MATEAPWEVIRRAADLIEGLAGKATRGPWASAEGRLVLWRTEPMTRLVGSDFGMVVARDVDDGDRDWIAALSPAVAEPLVAWLRAAADSLELHAPVWEEPDPGVHPRRTRGEVDRLIGHHFGHALTLSRRVLGEQPCP